MSSPLAIAGVTAVLKDLLNNGLIDHDVSTHVGDVKVSSLPPDRITAADEAKDSQLNLFLYQVTPNPGWRNVGLPSRADRGERLSNPPLALDLHYLLTAYGKVDLEAEILLGYAMQLLHETPVLGRKAIRAALGGAAPLPVGDDLLPGSPGKLSAADLAEQLELIKITPQTMSTEEISKLWAAIGGRYRLTAAYQASVVLIESKRPVRPTFPVRARTILVQPIARPEVREVRANTAEGRPIVAASTLVVSGSGLRGAITRLFIGGAELAPLAADITDTQITAALSLAPAGSLRAGVQGLQVVHRLDLGIPPVEHRAVESNVAPFVLQPSIVVGAPAAGKLELTFTPRIGLAQRVRLLLDELNPPATSSGRAYSIEAPVNNGIDLVADPTKTETATVLFDLAGVAPGTYLVRAQVDGAQSELGLAAGKYDAPKITLP